MNQKNAELAKGLRELADVIETCDIEIFKTVMPDISAFGATTKEDFSKVAKHFAPVEKGETRELVSITRMFGPVKFSAYINKERVCRKVTKTVTQEVEVWECPPILEAGSEQS